MKHIIINGEPVPVLIQGCMRIDKLTKNEILTLIQIQREQGICFFDHADIYGMGECETLFGEAMHMEAGLREHLILQSKCAIRPGKVTVYDCSKKYILSSVEGILKRLKTEYLDYFLLHRPDMLMEPEEVADAFEQLFISGKVHHFGVSNHTPAQIELLKKYVRQPIEVNQMQLSIAHTPMLDSGVYTNTMSEQAVNREGFLLDYSRMNDIVIQCYSPFQYGRFEGTFINNENFRELNEVLGRLAEQYRVTKNVIAAAWLLRHPGKKQVIIGSTNPERIQGLGKAIEMELTREEWYEIYAAAGNKLP